ncbi:MAG: nucleotidyltransferase domain-containing protein, partial [Clostridia bacterium]|nr:nucleotidyltransferase domain-containing protein [Clostridia bacterium]
MIQHEFSMLVYEAVERSRDALGNRFVAAYLHGSIEKGDAVAGVSDLDMMLISSEEDSAHDIPWITGMIVDLKEKYPVIDEAHIALMTLKQLKD